MLLSRLHKDVWFLDAKIKRDAARLYCEACAHLFDIKILGPESIFFNSLESYNLDGVLFAHCQGVAQRFQRTRVHARAQTADTIMVVLDLAGAKWRGDYDGRAMDDSQGALRFVDMSRPLDLTIGDFTELDLILPRALLGPQAALDFHGLSVSENSVSGRLLASHLRALWETVAQMTQTEARAAAQAAVALVAGAIAAHAQPLDADPRPVDRMLLTAGRAFIEAHLSDPDLSPEMVHKHLNVSRRLLYKAFEPIGGVQSFIQGRRLDQAFDAILFDRAEQQTLAEIGYAHGFKSNAHFTRTFQARFSVTPGRLRKLGEEARREGLSALERPDDVWSWLRRI